MIELGLANDDSEKGQPPHSLGIFAELWLNERAAGTTAEPTWRDLFISVSDSISYFGTR